MNLHQILVLGTMSGHVTKGQSLATVYIYVHGILVGDISCGKLISFYPGGICDGISVPKFHSPSHPFFVLVVVVERVYPRYPLTLIGPPRFGAMHMRDAIYT